jgi:hypothetical protein
MVVNRAHHAEVCQNRTFHPSALGVDSRWRRDVGAGPRALTSATGGFRVLGGPSYPVMLFGLALSRGSG